MKKWLKVIIGVLVIGGIVIYSQQISVSEISIINCSIRDGTFVISIRNNIDKPIKLNYIWLRSNKNNANYSLIEEYYLQHKGECKLNLPNMWNETLNKLEVVELSFDNKIIGNVTLNCRQEA